MPIVCNICSAPLSDNDNFISPSCQHSLSNYHKVVDPVDPDEVEYVGYLSDSVTNMEFDSFNEINNCGLPDLSVKFWEIISWLSGKNTKIKRS